MDDRSDADCERMIRRFIESFDFEEGQRYTVGDEHSTYPRTINRLTVEF